MEDGSKFSDKTIYNTKLLKYPKKYLEIACIIAANNTKDKKIVPYERKKNMKKLSKKNKIRQIKMLKKNLQKIKRRKNKRVKDEKK